MERRTPRGSYEEETGEGMRSVYLVQLLGQLSHDGGIERRGCPGRGFEEKGLGNCCLDRMTDLIQFCPSSSVTIRVVKPGAASGFIA